MNIIKKVQVKQILTNKSKNNLKQRFLEEKMRLEQECQQLLFEKKKMENKKALVKKEITKRFQNEINHRKEKISLIDFKLEQLEILEIGSEIVEKEVEALVEVKVGTHWEELNNSKAIVIKDGIVIRIDE